MFFKSALAVAAALSLAACATQAPAPMFSQASLPDAVKVPAGHKVALETVGVGEITYECRDKKDAAGQTEWVFVGPDAKLLDRNGKQVGKYYGPPATWESADGSKVTGAQVAIAPAGAGNIPLQLVKANPATGNGAMTGVTFIQRVATPPATKGQKQIVQYKSDYILYKAM
jgi:hypothetical protein